MSETRSSKPLSRLPRPVMVVAAIALAAGAWLLFRHFVPAAGSDTNIYATVQKEDIEDLVTATGSLQPRDYVDVGAQVSGQLRKILVEVGTEVKENDLLAEIDAEQSNARVDASKAQVRAQQAQLVEQQANLEKSERDLQRQKNLMAEDATTAETLQNAETTVAAARAQIDSLKAQMQQLAASMRVDAANLKYTKIFAPMAGTVVSITAKQGQTLNTNQQAPTILRIADLSTMTVQTQVSEADVSKLRIGMSAYFTTLGGSGRRYYGKLSKIEPTPTVTNNVVLYNALFDVPNSNNALLPQMTAQVFFVIAEAQGALAVPMSALTMQRSSAAGGAAVASSDAARQPGEGRRQRENGARPEGSRLEGASRPEGSARPRDGGERAPRGPRMASVKLAQADGALIVREVQVGVTNRVHAQILSGLEEGDRVVAGQKVEEKAPASQSQNRNAGVGGFGAGGFPPGGR